MGLNPGSAGESIARIWTISKLLRGQNILSETDHQSIGGQNFVWKQSSHERHM